MFPPSTRAIFSGIGWHCWVRNVNDASEGGGSQYLKRAEYTCFNLLKNWNHLEVRLYSRKLQWIPASLVPRPLRAYWMTAWGLGPNMRARKTSRWASFPPRTTENEARFPPYDHKPYELQFPSLLVILSFIPKLLVLFCSTEPFYLSKLCSRWQWNFRYFGGTLPLKGFHCKV